MMADADAQSEGSLRSSGKKPYSKRIVDGAQLRAAIFALYNDRGTSDVTVDAGGKRWHLHGNILSAWSGIWREEYSRGQRAFKVSDVDADVVEDLLRYFYSGELLLTAHNASILLTLSHTIRADALTRRLQEEEKSRTRSGTDGTPPATPLTGSNSSLSSAVASAYARPPLPSAPKPPLSPRPSSGRLPNSASGSIVHSSSGSPHATQAVSTATSPATSTSAAAPVSSPPSPSSPAPAPPVAVSGTVLVLPGKNKPQRPPPPQPRPANVPRASPFTISLATAQSSTSSTSVSSQIAAFNSASNGSPVAPTLSPRSRAPSLSPRSRAAQPNQPAIAATAPLASPSSTSVNSADMPTTAADVKDKPSLPSGSKPQLSPHNSPTPVIASAVTKQIAIGSRIQHSSTSPSLPSINHSTNASLPTSTAPASPVPPVSSVSSPNLLPVVEKRASPRREQETPPLQATPIPAPVAPTTPQQTERRLSSAGLTPVNVTTIPDDEAAKRAREKIKKMKKAEKEQSKAKEDVAYKQQLELLQRIALIESTHARIEAEAKEREKKERKEEEKKKAAQAAKRASLAPWQSASPAPRPASIRPVVDD